MSEPSWDRHCGELAADAVRRACGRDIWAEIGPPPRSWREAAELYRRQGVRSLTEIVTKLLGEPTPVRQARRGDVVIKGWALGVCAGDVAVFAGGEGVPMAEVEKAWRVGGGDG